MKSIFIARRGTTRPYAPSQTAECWRNPVQSTASELDRWGPLLGRTMVIAPYYLEVSASQCAGVAQKAHHDAKKPRLAPVPGRQYGVPLQ